MLLPTDEAGNAKGLIDFAGKEGVMPRTKLESEFNKDLNDELEKRLPGCYILKQDPNMRQGIPDKLILFEDKWAALETKRGFKKDKKQPNQDHYVREMNEMSFAAFVDPENMQEVLNDLQDAFGVGR